VAAVDRVRPREHRHLLLSFFSFAYAVRFVLPVFVFYLGADGYDPELSPSPIPLTAPDVARGILAALIGYAVMLAAFALPIGRYAANIVPRLRREWSAETAIAVALITIPIGWAVVLASTFGLIPARAGSGVLGTLAAGTGFGIGLIALCYQRYRSKAALLLLALVIPPTMLFNFFTATKMLFLIPLLMIAFSNIVVTRRLRGSWVVGGLLFMVLFYPVARAYREYMQLNSFTTAQVLTSPGRAVNLISTFSSSTSLPEHLREGMLSTAARLDGLGILSTIVRDAGTRVPFQGGWSLGYIPISYVPRLLWPGKPVLEIGQWVTDNYGAGPEIESSTGATWPGELFFNFGWTGLFIGMALLGLWFRFLEEYFLRIDATIPALMASIVIILFHVLIRTLFPAPTRLPPPM